MATTLPPPPTNDAQGSYSWLEWFRQLRNYITVTGSVPWGIINFAGSNISDIVSRSHQSLQSLQGGTSGQYYHLTQAQATDLLDAGDTTLHYHAADRALANATGTLAVGNGGTGATTLAANQVLFGNGTSAVAQDSLLWWDAANDCLVVGTTSPTGLAAASDLYLETGMQIKSMILSASSNNFNFIESGTTGTDGKGLYFGAAAGAAGGSVEINPGAGTSAGGSYTVNAGAGANGGGVVSLNGGSTTANDSTAGWVNLTAGGGSGLRSTGGSLSLIAGPSDDTTNGIGGDIYLVPGDAGTKGNVFLMDAAFTPIMQIAGTAQLGFFSATPVTQPTVSGSRGGNAALASLLTALANLGLIVDTTT